MASNYQNYSTSNDLETLNSNISSNIYKIRQNVSRINQLGKLIGTSKDTESVRNDIHQTFQNTNQIAKESNIYLKQLSNIKTNNGEMAFSKSKRAFESELANYSRMQKEVSDKLRLAAPVAEESINTNNDEGSIFEQDERTSLLKQKKVQELDSRHEYVRDRETKINQIESDVLDINSIMKDLASMVNDQSSLIDNISSNVENTYNDVETGNSQLRQANSYASKYRKKICILIAIVFIFAIALGIIIYFSVKK